MADNNGFRKVKGCVKATIGLAGTRKVVAYDPEKRIVLLKDESRKGATPFEMPLSKVALDKKKLLSSLR